MSATYPNPVALLLHRASLAISQGNPALALRFVEQARSEHTKAADPMESVLPELRALALTQRMAQAVRFQEQQSVVLPGLLSGFVSCLEREEAGRAALDAAQRDDTAAVHASLEVLAQRDSLEPETAHHLAVIYHRGVQCVGESDPGLADRLWRLSWRCWLRWAQTAKSSDRNLVFSCLLTEHRTSIRDLLARNAIDAARRHWRRIMDLAGNPLLARRIDAFRDELATEYLVLTRESMRYGTIPAGYDADYETALNWLTRLLSLDRDNPRLLTDLVSICAEWFHECYAISDLDKLAQGVERFTPFALQLGRLIERSKGAELTARSALAEFTKFRGYVADDPQRKAELYREAEHWHPTHHRQLPRSEAQP
jgi:hypothetical protein